MLPGHQPAEEHVVRRGLFKVALHALKQQRCIGPEGDLDLFEPVILDLAQVPIILKRLGCICVLTVENEGHSRRHGRYRDPSSNDQRIRDITSGVL